MSALETSPELRGTSAVDNSLKGPVLFLLISGAKWLILASILGYLVSWKSHNPGFLNGCELLTIGRVQAAYTTAFLYGFGCNISFAIGLWLIARLSGTPIGHGLVLILASICWNLALTVGLVGILMGHLNAFEFLELPSYVAPPLFISSLVFSIWGILCFKNRTNEITYAAEWYLVAAFLAFPWINLATKTMLFIKPSSGVVQALVASWFANNFLWLWFGSLAIAALYYLVPKLLSKAVLSYNLAILGFVLLIFVGSWMGAARLVGGPFPAWVITSGIAASITMVAFFAITGINFFGTLWRNRKSHSENGILLFVWFSSLALLISGLLTAFISLRGVAEVTQFTIFLDAHRFLIFYGVFSMAAFAVVYYMLPRLLERDWPMEFMISSHFWLAFVGTILLVVPLTLGGWQQGAAMLDATVPFSEVVRHTSYWMVGRSAAWIFLSLGHLGFIMHLFVMLKPECDACFEELTRIDSEKVEGTEV